MEELVDKTMETANQETYNESYNESYSEPEDVTSFTVQVNDVFKPTVDLFLSKTKELHESFELALSAYFAGQGYNIKEYVIEASPDLTTFTLKTK